MYKIVIITAAIIIATQGISPAARYELNRQVPAELIEQSKAIMLNEVGQRETGHNRGIADKYNRSLNLPLGSPYCQSGQYWSYWQACNEFNFNYKLIPMPRNGMANSTYDYIRRNGRKTKYKPQVNDFIVWKSPRNYTGHIERIISVGRAGWVKTVGFNTSSGRRGSQRDGGGVWKRNRNIRHPLGSRGIRGLAGVNYVSKWGKDCERHANLAR